MAATAGNVVLALFLGLLFVCSADASAAAPDPRIEAAERVYRERGPNEALPVFEQLAREFATKRDVHSEAVALHYAGECRWRLGEFAKAHDDLGRALKLERTWGDRRGQARTLNVLGLLAWEEGYYDEAIERFRHAGTIARSLGDRKLEGTSLNNLSLVYDELGDYDTSLAQYRRVLELYEGADFARGVGDTLGNIGGVHLLLGHYREALGYYQQALEISTRLKSTTAMSQDHGNLGLCLLGLGEVDAALGHIDRAIDLATQAGMETDRAYWIGVKGRAYVDQGRYDLALDAFRESIELNERIGAQAEYLEALRRAAELHLALGDTASAERDFRRALDGARTVGLDRAVTANLVALGDVEVRRERPEAAIALFDQARQRAEAAGMQQALAQSLLRLALVQRSAGQVEAATKGAERALRIALDIEAPALEAEALYARAELERTRGRYAAALESYAAADAAQKRIGDPDLQWRIDFGRAGAQEATGDVQAALESLRRAVQVIEGVRDRLQEARFRSGYVEDKFEVYRELMRLQLRQGRVEDAFSTAERLRARSFVQQLGGRTSLPLTDADRRRETQLRERVRRLQQSMQETDDQGAPAYSVRALTRFSEELRRAESDYQAFLDDHVRADGAGAATGTAASAIRRRLAADEALVEFVVAPGSLVVFVLTRGGIEARTLPLRAEDLGAQVALLRDLVRRPGDERWRKPAARLAAELLAPLEQAGWLDGVARLYLVPHGVLTYLPFAVLPRSPPDGELLIDRYAVAYLPAAAALLRDSAPTREAAAGTMLAVAPARGSLRHTVEEVRAVDALYRPDARALIGAEASENRFKQLAGGFRVVHLATHGYFNKASPLLSGLALEPDRSDDGLLRVHEILDLELRADLVTLSACDTALGSGYFADLPVGDEFVALNRAFLAAGSDAVMATLWQVQDRASVAVMKQFYVQLRASRAQHGPADALASTQRELRRSSRFGHPYYWAAYVVMGRAAPGVAVARKSPGRSS